MLNATSLETDRPSFISRGTMLAVVATTVPGIFQSVYGTDTVLTVVLGTLGVIVLVLSTFGIAWAEKRPGVRELGIVTALYGAAVCAMLYLSSGRAFLVIMPFVSMMVLYFSLRAALLVNLGLIAFSGPCFTPLVDDVKQLVGGIAGFASSVAFVFVFSLIARRERYARRDIERLAKEVEELATIRERNRIAREIHDTLGHYLTVANVQVEAARASTEGREERLLRVQQLLRDGLTELRSSVSLLREGASAVKPFAQALDGLVAECNATGLAAALTTSGAARPLPAQVSFTLFRAAQEALTNVRRHARASTVKVLLHYAEARVKLDVHDDGVGGAATPGNGLKGIEERVQQVGGTFVVTAPTGGGFQLSVEVPA